MNEKIHQSRFLPSISSAFENKTILLAGASGFLGKVWLSFVLYHLPNIERVYVILRKKGNRSALTRFTEMLNSSYAFFPLHKKYKDHLQSFVLNKISVLEGDVSKDHFGLSHEKYEDLLNCVDLFVNSAGLVDFNPDIRTAKEVNIDGTKNSINFILKAKKARLVHISTCYVAGQQNGRISEIVNTQTTPFGISFQAKEEYVHLSNEIARLEASQESVDFKERVKLALQERGIHESDLETSQRARTLSQLIRRRILRDRMVDFGTKRAKDLGWTNTYTYTKAIAENLIVEDLPLSRFTILRPAIVESSNEFPFPGWNEGFNTSGPLAYLLAGWFRFLPSKLDQPFDVIPVDYVARALTITSCALLHDLHFTVYHCGTSDLNTFTIDRACELTALAHRQHYRRKGQSFLEREILSRWDAVSVGRNYPFAVRRLEKTFGRIHRFARKGDSSDSFLGAWLQRFSDWAGRLEKKLGQVNGLIELFLPFIHDFNLVFETRNILSHNIVDKTFCFDFREFNWRHYWMNIHIPGLRRWCFPRIEGGQEEKYHPAFPVSLSEAPLSPDKSEANERIAS